MGWDVLSVRGVPYNVGITQLLFGFLSEGIDLYVNVYLWESSVQFSSVQSLSRV